MKAIIIYYSLTGKTELVAKTIAKTLNIDTIKIEEAKKRKGLFGFINNIYNARKEKYVEIKQTELKLKNYDIIFIGTLVWALKPTPAINTFISKANLKNKKIILFVTMGNFGAKNTIKILSNKIKLKKGKVIDSFIIKTGGVKKEDIIKKGKEIGKKYINKIKAK